ncbi:MAG: hypothetical protein MSH60_00915 [Ruminococcus sp.]|uniref:hypothetical protein n=1 Tax=Eubacterium sp. TaxID=142586 RepID=UPI0025BBC2C5|nr:hypothetical protein [Eubacterium sp.]MCI7349299.1 hypothetical protein [Ruminococcus sp.]MCI7800299.1 hypothetical protein [Eubacterium sp.]
MATKSILKSIVIKDKKTGNALVNALENARNKTSKDVTFSRAVRTADDETISKIFGERK